MAWCGYGRSGFRICLCSPSIIHKQSHPHPDRVDEAEDTFAAQCLRAAGY
ncbi:MAG: hypothetical protein NT070_13800 [Cyanobacteria bacterium]|nr:hypothetical protein [Cyanobacteriota bacterium]